MAERKYSEADLTWSSVEKYQNYKAVNWTIDKNGIPIYSFLDENGKRIELGTNSFLYD